jgi:hypothetical protein
MPRRARRPSSTANQPPSASDSRPTCRRCLGEHWDAECGYSATEAKAAHAARSTAKPIMRPAAIPSCLLDGRHTPASPWGCRVTLNSKVSDQDPIHASAPAAPAESKITGRANGEPATSSTPPTNKPSRRGRPRVDPTWRLAGAAARQRAYRHRQRRSEGRTEGRASNSSGQVQSDRRSC